MSTLEQVPSWDTRGFVFSSCSARRLLAHPPNPLLPNSLPLAIPMWLRPSWHGFYNFRNHLELQMGKIMSYCVNEDKSTFLVYVAWSDNVFRNACNMRPQTEQKMCVISGAKAKLHALAPWVGTWCSSLPALFWFLFFLLLLCPFAVLNTSLLCWRLGSLLVPVALFLVSGGVFELKGQSCEAPGDVPCEKARCDKCLIHPHLIFVMVVTLIPILQMRKLRLREVKIQTQHPMTNIEETIIF